jgi:hypothetical protein
MDKFHHTLVCRVRRMDEGNPVTTIEDPNSRKPILIYSLIKTAKRLTFEIHHQDPEHRYTGSDEGKYWSFEAPNGYEVISRSRLGIHCERIWLLGGTFGDAAEFSSTMAFTSDEKRDKAFTMFHDALAAWGDHRMSMRYGNHQANETDG